MFIDPQMRPQGEVQQVGKLRMSEAIRLGCQRSAPTHDIGVMAWVTWDRGRCFSCVIGAAYLGATGKNEKEYWEKHDSPLTAVPLLFGITRSTFLVAQDMYEKGGKSREQIADWLESQGH